MNNEDRTLQEMELLDELIKNGYVKVSKCGRRMSYMGTTEFEDQHGNLSKAEKLKKTCTVDLSGSAGSSAGGINSVVNEDEEVGDIHAAYDTSREDEAGMKFEADAESEAMGELDSPKYAGKLEDDMMANYDMDEVLNLQRELD